MGGIIEQQTMNLHHQDINFIGRFFRWRNLMTKKGFT